MADLLCYSLQSMSPVTPPLGVVLGLGNFDGVHVAHRELLNLVQRLCDHHSANPSRGVFCFSKPSADYLLPTPLPRLCTLEQKLELFRDCGMEYAFVADFSKIMHLSPEEFVNDVLIKKCHCAGAVCGFNYHFGKNGHGNAQTLEALLPAPVLIQEAVYDGKTPISSTRIRGLLLEGKVEEAALLLSRPYSFTSTVIHGKSLGRKLGTPTINQAFPEGMLIPQKGVYVTDCEVNGKVYRAVSNVGIRPTVEQDATINCESYLLDFSGDLYEKSVKVSFLKRIRGERTFGSTKELTEQIQKDVLFAKNIGK